MNTYIKGCSFTRLLYACFNFTSSLLYHLFYTRRMNSTVGNKLFKSNASDFSSNRIKARKSNCFRCIIDNKLNSCQLFKHLDVSSFSTDYASLHVFTRERYNRNCCFNFYFIIANSKLVTYLDV